MSRTAGVHHPAGRSSRILDVNGQRLHVVVEGEGPLVLLVHGFPESWYSWRHQLTPLADAGYRVVAPDMRGYGRSSKPREVAAYRITELVEDLVGVVRALGEETAVVVGHDWGAPIAWSAAWTRPDVFRAVAAMSVAFGGRGLMALPGDPLGERRPSVVAAELAGEGKRFYQTYHADPTGSRVELEGDTRRWLRCAMYGFSGDVPLPPEAAGTDFLALDTEAARTFVRDGGLCLPHGTRMLDFMPDVDELPAWITEQDLDFYVEEFERTGFWGVNYYANLDLNWELLSRFHGTPVTVPAMFIGGDRDVATIWARDAIDLFPTTVPLLRESVMLRGCGHWTQQERPQETNDALLRFLASLD